MYKITPKVPTFFKSRGMTDIPFYVEGVTLNPSRTIQVKLGGGEEMLPLGVTDYVLEPSCMPQAKISTNGKTQLRVLEDIPVFRFEDGTPGPTTLCAGTYSVVHWGLRTIPDNNPFFGYLYARLDFPVGAISEFILPPESLSKVSLTAVQVTTFT